MDKNNFNDFLICTLSQKEVSLVIAKDGPELKKFIEMLEIGGFRQTIDSVELFKYIETPSKVFFIIHDKLPKDIYDFITQYPTGQIEIFDKQILKSKIATPVYDGVSVIFLITKPSLKHVQEAGFQILNQVGVTYQS